MVGKFKFFRNIVPWICIICPQYIILSAFEFLSRLSGICIDNDISICNPQTLQNSLDQPKFSPLPGMPPHPLHPQTEVYIEGVDVTATLKIIEFCYTSAISLTKDSVWPTLTAAIKVCLTAYLSACLPAYCLPALVL